LLIADSIYVQLKKPTAEKVGKGGEEEGTSTIGLPAPLRH